MPLAGSRRFEDIADFEEDREIIAEAMKSVEAKPLPTVDISGKGTSLNAIVADPAVRATSSGAIPKEKKTKTAIAPKRKGSEVEGDAQTQAKKHKKTMASGSTAQKPIIDLEGGEIPSMGSGADTAAIGVENLGIGLVSSARQNSPSVPSPILFNKDFLEKSDAPGWGQQMHAALIVVPPLPNLIRRWTCEARQTVGNGLAKRINADVTYPSAVDAKKSVEMAISEFGLAAYAISTCPHSALEGAKQGAARELQLQADMEAANALADERQAEFDRVTSEVEERIKKVRNLADEKEASMVKLRSEYEEKLRAVEQKLLVETKAHQEAEKSLKSVRVEFEASLKTAEDKLRVAETSATTAIAEATEAKKRVETAVEKFKEGKEYWDSVFACYDQGLYHMARCFTRAGEEGKVPTMTDLVDFSLADPCEPSLVKYHPIIRFSDVEMGEYNEDRRKKKKHELAFPTVVTPNIQDMQKERERINKEKADAARATKKKADKEKAEKSAEDIAKKD